MSFVSQIENAIEKELDRVATVINYELKQACPKRTGEAAASIHIENTGKYSRFVGGTNLHLYFSDEGNGTGGIPKSGARKPLPISGGNGQWVAFRTSPFRNYPGKHFVKDVAAKHGG